MPEDTATRFVIVHSCGHSPAKLYKLTEAEIGELTAIELRYGELCHAENDLFDRVRVILAPDRRVDHASICEYA